MVDILGHAEVVVELVREVGLEKAEFVLGLRVLEEIREFVLFPCEHESLEMLENQNEVNHQELMLLLATPLIDCNVDYAQVFLHLLIVPEDPVTRFGLLPNQGQKPLEQTNEELRVVQQIDFHRILVRPGRERHRLLNELQELGLQVHF